MDLNYSMLDIPSGDRSAGLGDFAARVIGRRTAFEL